MHHWFRGMDAPANNDMQHFTVTLNSSFGNSIIRLPVSKYIVRA